mmetsp:Transcript_36395/g.88151  ORF Transcript_36395/g.88151 Transcript_36395/m.88151 type:complete len:262 (+) Transcript_36395:825-1610(+)
MSTIGILMYKSRFHSTKLTSTIVVQTRITSFCLCSNAMGVAKGTGYTIAFLFQCVPRGEGACLLIITSLYHRDAELVVDEVKAYWKGATQNQAGSEVKGVILLTGLKLKALVRLYNSVDAFVLPSRGEGWGRPYMEAMAMGLPVIATNWSGPTEFVNEDNGYLLPIKGLVDANLDSFPGHKWADPDPVVLTEFMKHLSENPAQGKVKGQRARKDAVEKWSNLALSRDVARELQRLAGRSSDNVGDGAGAGAKKEKCRSSEQ